MYIHELSNVNFVIRSLCPVHIHDRDEIESARSVKAVWLTKFLQNKLRNTKYCVFPECLIVAVVIPIPEKDLY